MRVYDPAPPEGGRLLARGAALLVVLGLVGGACSRSPAFQPTPTAVGADAGVSPGSIDRGGGDALVVRVIDGDTLVVNVGGSEETVRLIGINAPETEECWAAQAAAELSRLAPEGSPVGLTADVSDRDPNGRLLRYLWTPERVLVNEELVRRGAALAVRYPPDTAFADRLEAAQAQAEAAGIGIWAPDACGPAVEAEVGITAVNADPPGDDTLRLNDEWVEVTNYGLRPVPMEGWAVRDESSSNRFFFPDGFVLLPKRRVRIHSGCGAPTSEDLFWCVGRAAVWNNDGDTVFLLDPAGNVHDLYAYGKSAGS